MQTGLEFRGPGLSDFHVVARQRERKARRRPSPEVCLPLNCWKGLFCHGPTISPLVTGNEDVPVFVLSAATRILIVILRPFVCHYGCRA